MQLLRPSEPRNARRHIELSAVVPLIFRGTRGRGERLELTSSHRGKTKIHPYLNENKRPNKVFRSVGDGWFVVV